MAMLKHVNPETSVVTSIYVMNESMPILYLSCDDDEEGGVLWQIHCGNGDYSMGKMLLVRAETVLNLDVSIGELDLRVGQEATRSSISSDWVVKTQL